ncbi:von Willebrand factor A, partial [Vibrio parahaemolyticus]|uniref:hypothetical protein n=1 Tax=Vibrio parahaemolyticus TaxID=670 RepID=UPI0006C01309
ETDEIREQEFVSEKQGHRKNKNRCPMVICLDTSGSMQSLPENIAKATVLECMKVAHKKKMRCYVYLFGSKKEISELELPLDVSGFNELLNFLTLYFGGGIVDEEPPTKALEKCDSEEWSEANILLVSDGDFSTSSDLSRNIKYRKDTQGLQ